MHSEPYLCFEGAQLALAKLCDGVSRHVVEYPHAGGASEFYVSGVPLLQVSGASGGNHGYGRAMYVRMNIHEVAI